MLVDRDQQYAYMDEEVSVFSEPGGRRYRKRQEAR